MNGKEYRWRIGSRWYGHASMYMAVGLSMFAFLGCSSDSEDSGEETGGVKTMTFIATQEESSTRAAISEDDSKVIVWKDNDAISVFSGETNNKFTLKSGANTAKGEFTGTIATPTASGYMAVYPYQSGITSSGESFSGVTLKSEQTATPGTFDPETAIMVAKAAAGSKNLAFRNVLSYVKITTETGCHNLILKSNNGESISGTIAVDYNNGTPTATVSDGSNMVTLVPQEGQTTIAPGTYYFAVLPQSLSKGFTVACTNSLGDDVMKASSKAVTFSRNKVLNLGSFNLYDDTNGGDFTKIDYFTLSSDGEISVTAILPSNIEYSVGGGDWTTCFGMGPEIYTFGGSNGDMRFRAKDNPQGLPYSGKKCNINWSSATQSKEGIQATGDIRTLIDYLTYENVNTSQAKFDKMFYNCTQLTSISRLQATELAAGCYSQMFEGCTGLTWFSLLPATYLPSKCYYRMFYGCENLTDVTICANEAESEDAYTDWLEGTALDTRGTLCCMGTLIPSYPSNWKCLTTP